MKSKENAGKLQLILNKFNKKIKIIRNSKLNRKSIHKNRIKDEIIQKKTSQLKNSLEQIKSDDIEEIMKSPEDIENLIDLTKLEKEIYEEKLLKKELFKDEKKISEKKLLNEFFTELDTDEWKEIFKNEPRIVMVLDNAKTHKSLIGRKIAKILNIKLVFLEKYSSNLNPIERVWYSIKNKLSTTFIEDEIFLMRITAKYFYIYANSLTLKEKWLDTFIS
jgi:hypothetical protein